VRSRRTSFADMRLIPRCCVSIAWHVPNDKLSSSAISLIVKSRFPRITALTRSTVSLVRAADGQPVCGSSSMEVRPFLNREYHSNCLGPIQRCFSEWLLKHFVRFCGRLTSSWQNLMQTRCSFNTSISQYDGGINTIAL
jgi:hypothetical protein